MNVLLLNSNIVRCARSGYPQTPAPTGLIYLAGVLVSHGHRVKIDQVESHVIAQDEDGLPLVRKELEGIFQEFSPDLIGISVRNVGAARRPANPFHLIEYYSVFYDARIVRACRMLTQAPIVMGGSALSVEPGLYVKYARPDYAIVGEGEVPLLELVETLSAGRQPTGMPGLLTGSSDLDACETYARLEDMSAIGRAACDVVANYREHYYDEGGYAGIQAKRGCPMGCIYCTTPFLEGCQYRYRPMSHVIEEIKAYQDCWGIRHFFFLDATFNDPLEHGLSICNAILEAGLQIEWFSEITPSVVTDELCRMMKKSGCIGLTMSPDSCSETVLKAYDKPFGMAEVENAIRLVAKHDIAFDVRLIVGGPGETMETLAESFRFCAEHLQDEAVGFYDGMVITSRAPVYRIAVDEGLIDPSRPYEEIVFENDFRAMKHYEYFFPHIEDSRRKLAELLDRTCIGEHWRITSRDFAPDPETGEFGFKPGISVPKGARPWFSGWSREAAKPAAGQD
jgi:radical SAM superfamily enzyme YgiQ (UPF0313 family)